MRWNDEPGTQLSRRTFTAGGLRALAVSSLPAGGILTMNAATADSVSDHGQRLPVRTVTAGINLDGQNPSASLDAAAAFLDTAQEILIEAGFEVQTTRMTTQPHAEYGAQLRFDEWRQLVADITGRLGSHRISLGPGLIDDRSDKLAGEKLIHNASAGVSSSLSIGSQATGVHHRAIATAAEVIQTIAQQSPDDNFNFGAIANVSPGVPFFPGGFHGGQDNSFALGTQGAGLFMDVCQAAGGFQSAGPALLETYGSELRRLETTARMIEKVSGWRYAGIDPTPAQWGEASIGTAVESLIDAPFGSPGTLAACRLMTQAIKQVPVEQTGYAGLFLPPMEDATLARRAYDHYGLDTLLQCSAVCGTGLDAVPLPGDSSLDELGRVLTDVAGLAVQLDKPLTARLFPVPGKQAGEMTGQVRDLFPMKVLAIR